MSLLLPGWKVFGVNRQLQSPCDVAVILPTIGRRSVLDAVASVYTQSNHLQIHLLIGIDTAVESTTPLETLLNNAPSNITPILFYPGYSTSVRHGGMHLSRDGGSLRTVLSYLANARYLAYLDDDNWWEPNHLNSLVKAIKNRRWAFSLRSFVHPVTKKKIAEDCWESVGINRGLFADRFGGFVDPNCLLIDKFECEPALRWWSIPLPNDPVGMSADRHVFHWLSQNSEPGETGEYSVNYVIQENDVNHSARLQLFGEHNYIIAGQR